MAISLTQELFLSLKKKYLSISPYLNERSRRIWAATEAQSLGYGGMKIINHVTGISYPTIKKGIDELKLDADDPVSCLRKSGGGRKKNIIKDNELGQDIETIIEASTRENPESVLLWCSKSTRKIADALNKSAQRASHTLIANTLKSMGYSLQSNRKSKEGIDHHHPLWMMLPQF